MADKKKKTVKQKKSARKPGSKKIPTSKNVKKRVPTKKTAHKKKKSLKPSRKKTIIKWCIVALIWLVIFMIGFVSWCVLDLPRIDYLMDQSRRQSITFYDRQGQKINSYGDAQKIVKLENLPEYVPQAVLAIEDHRFYSHFGFDIWGTLRAATTNLFSMKWKQGGSTITQQLAKNVFLTPEKTIKRKVQELILSFWLERNFSKDQILSIYLQRIYFGQGCYGIESASEKFFRKSAKELSLEEAALLAGIIKAPTHYNPIRHYENSIKRSHLVLDNMVQYNFIDSLEAMIAKSSESITLYPSYSGSKRYFTDWAMRELKQLSGIKEHDLNILTTLDTNLQKKAEKAISQTLESLDEKLQIALITLSPQGEVLAMIGGRNYHQSQFNRSYQALRQPGSAFKLFTYLAGLQNGWTPETKMIDQKVYVNGWSPQNYTKKHYGEMTLREAFARSINTIPVKISQKIGLKKIIRVAQKMGITTSLKKHPSIVLGSQGTSLIELTKAYAIIANQGRPIQTHGIKVIENNDSVNIYRRSYSKLPPLFTQNQIQQIQEMLRYVVTHGTGKKAYLPHSLGGKTGTSSQNRDAWFIGYTNKYVTGIWVGYDDNQPMKDISGSNVPAIVWKNFMTSAYTD